MATGASSPARAYLDGLTRYEAAALALEASRRASGDLAAAWRAAPGPPGIDLERARILVARSRNRSVPASAPLRLARTLADVATEREAALRRGLQLLASAQRYQDEGRQLVRHHRIRASLTDAERRQLLAAARRPTKAQRARLKDLALGAPGVLALNDDYAPLVRARLVEALEEVVRLRLTAELSFFAAHERQRRTETTRLADVEALAEQVSTVMAAGFAGLYRLLRAASASDAEVAAAAEVLALKGRQAARALAPLAAGLHRWATPRAMELRYRNDHAAASLALASALRAGLLGLATGLYVAAAFGAGVDDLTDPWRTAAAARRLGGRSALDRARPAPAGGRRAGRVRGIVESIDHLQVTKAKRVALLRVRRGRRAVTTVALAFFNPRYVGIRPGTIVDWYVHGTNDVLAEYANPRTARKLAEMTQRFGGTSGGVVDRRNLGEEAETSWTTWLVTQVRPMYDAVPDSINGTWSLGNWFALALASGTAY